MAMNKLRDYLDAHHVRYAVISHSPAYTAPEIAQSAHVPGKQLAKTVIVKVDGRLVMAVLPSTQHVHTEAMRKSIGAQEIVLASESEFAGRFPDCEPGAMPPFGHLYGIEVFVSPRLAEDEMICFNAGNHRELIRMSYADFERLAQPVPLTL
ncbi:YbaK/EbsC family protein [Fontimonas sp. SYSU GA230001]|uniref:aminoacyl-tRNA deacylase n=1 Tax=Fontimonas sp. SYSU GA230001 TaxID=3142450 RepID=UPI0032B61BB1